jgi:hypothetical protein
LARRARFIVCTSGMVGSRLQRSCQWCCGRVSPLCCVLERALRRRGR